jgi:hypothetical protein
MPFVSSDAELANAAGTGIGVTGGNEQNPLAGASVIEGREESAKGANRGNKVADRTQAKVLVFVGAVCHSGDGSDDRPDRLGEGEDARTAAIEGAGFVVVGTGAFPTGQNVCLGLGHWLFSCHF